MTQTGDVVGLETPNLESKVDSPGGVYDRGDARLKRSVGDISKSKVRKTQIRWDSGELGRMMVGAQTLLYQGTDDLLVGEVVMWCQSTCRQ